MSLFSSLRREQREAIGLLQIGTFLEYFDLMLYVHMAVLLNDLFFPKTDPHTASLIAAFAFCSTYVLRPFGALLFGYIGDHIGRKTTVIITTMMMAVSCLIMANLPTYSQIGITAAWGVTLCRVIQSMASQGELMGTEIYLTEITKPPLRYVVVSLASFFSSFGGLVALMLATLLALFSIEWRLAFWIGAGIALVGSAARTRLKETPEFVDMKRRIKKAVEESSRDGLGRAADLLKSTNILWKEKVNKATALSYFVISCGFPACFYIAYIYSANILKVTYHYSPEQIIKQNFIVSLFHCGSFLLYSFLTSKVNPLTILRIKLFIFSPFVIISPYILSISSTPLDVLFFQCFIMTFGITDVPGSGVFINHFPILKRFTTTSLMYAFSRAIVYVITSFGLVYLADAFGHYGLWIIMIPLSIAFFFGIKHFEVLEYETRHDNPETAFRRQTV